MHTSHIVYVYMTILKPLFQDILVKKLESEEAILMEDDYINPISGEVVEVGNGSKDIPMQLSKREKVLFFKRDAKEINFEGSKFFLINQHDVILIEEYA